MQVGTERQKSRRETQGFRETWDGKAGRLEPRALRNKEEAKWFVNSTESLREGAYWLWGGTIWVKSWELGATAVQP